eukprot:m.92503 g.92503  ORF g.92503 m.92503 type:complete len:187 (-) comp14948_c0_seq1:2098-2658(-)
MAKVFGIDMIAFDRAVEPERAVLTTTVHRVVSSSLASPTVHIASINKHPSIFSTIRKTRRPEPDKTAKPRQDGRHAFLLCLTFAIDSAGHPLYDTALPFISEVTFQQKPASKPSFVASGPSSVGLLIRTEPLYLASQDRFFDAKVRVAYVYLSADQVEWQPVANITPMFPEAWAQQLRLTSQAPQW